MNNTNFSSDVNEAKDMVADIIKSIDEINKWSSNEAEKQINLLLDNWKLLCENTASAKSREFCDKCEQILLECTAFQNEIAAKNESFKETVQDQLPVISTLAGDNEVIKSLLDQVIGQLWNEIERPRLLFLYDKSVELETSIQGMVELAMTA